MTWTTGIKLGPVLIHTAPAAEDRIREEERTTLYVLWRDYRRVLYSRPWPRWCWPWRRWWIDAWRTRLAYRVGPARMQEFSEFNERMARDHVESCLSVAELRREVGHERA